MVKYIFKTFFHRGFDSVEMYFTGKYFMQSTFIQSRIYEIRGQNVMLDYDLAQLYEVPTKVLNQAVKRHKKRFPPEFMFRLIINDLQTMRSQFVTASQQKRNRSFMPYAFTEHGISMLASVLNSEKAVQMNILIIKAFISLRHFALKYKELAEEIGLIKQTIHDQAEQLNLIQLAIEKIVFKKDEQKSWEDRERIGFKT